jgi:hypothetical protein
MPVLNGNIDSEFGIFKSHLPFKDSRCNFIKTLQESVPSLNVHIISIFQFNDFCESNGPLMIFKNCPDYSYTTYASSMKLTGFICTSGTCLYNTGFPIE